MKKISDKDLQTQTREDIYNRLSRILTEAEEYWRTNNDEMIGYENELYSMLVRIQNNWEDITADIQKPESNLTTEDEPIMSPEEFKERLEEAEASNDWRDVLETIQKEQEPNNQRVSYHEMPLSNIAIEYLSELAHNNVMQNISYEDYLTEEQAEVYRTALSI